MKFEELKVGDIIIYTDPRLGMLIQQVTLLNAPHCYSFTVLKYTGNWNIEKKLVYEFSFIESFTKKMNPKLANILYD